MAKHRVSNQPFREAFNRAGDTITLRDVAEHMGWFRNKTTRGKTFRVPDSSSAEKRLGLRGATDGKTGKVHVTTTIDEDVALKLLPLFPSLDPVDVDV